MGLVAGALHGSAQLRVPVPVLCGVRCAVDDARELGFFCHGRRDLLLQSLLAWAILSTLAGTEILELVLLPLPKELRDLRLDDSALLIDCQPTEDRGDGPHARYEGTLGRAARYATRAAHARLPRSRYIRPPLCRSVDRP